MIPKSPAVFELHGLDKILLKNEKETITWEGFKSLGSSYVALIRCVILYSVCKLSTYNSSPVTPYQ